MKGLNLNGAGEMSADARLLFAFHICMGVLWVVSWSGALTIQDELVVAGLLFAVGAIISIWHKLDSGWRWRGIGFAEIIGAIISALLLAAFLCAGTPLFPPSDPKNFPWYLGAANLGLFGILGSLRLVSSSEDEFRADCGIEQFKGGEEATPPEAFWKRAARGVLVIVFISSWCAGLAHFYFFGRGIREGTRIQTMQNTEALHNHGDVVYVTSESKHLIDVLDAVSIWGVFGVLIWAAIFQFGFGVKMMHWRGSKDE